MACNKRSCKALEDSTALRVGAAHNFNEDLTVILSALKKAQMSLRIVDFESRRWITEAQVAAHRMAHKANILLKLK